MKGDIFSDPWMFYISVSILALTMPLCLIFHGGIILFGFSDHGRQRGLIPRLTSWLSLAVIPSITMMTAFKIFRVLKEKPCEFCEEANLIAFFFLFIALITIDQILLLRYLYLCVWKHIGFLHEDFLGVFLPIYNAFISGVFTSLLWFGGMMPKLGLYNKNWCQMNREEEPFSKNADIIRQLMLSMPVIIAFIFLLMMTFERRQLQLQDSKATREHLTLITFLSLCIIEFTLLMGKSTPALDGAVSVVMIDVTILPMITSALLPLVYYWANPRLRQFVRKRFRSDPIIVI